MAVAGVEGEPVSLTEPVTEAIAVAFAAWLVDKKKADRRLKISVGHDSRISAQTLLVTFQFRHELNLQCASLSDSAIGKWLS